MSLRLREMGLLVGTAITLVRTAPLGDPLEIKVRGYHLTLRKSEAQHVLIERHGLEERARLPPVHLVGADADVLGVPERQRDEAVDVAFAELSVEDVSGQRWKAKRVRRAGVALVQVPSVGVCQLPADQDSAGVGRGYVLHQADGW